MGYKVITDTKPHITVVTDFHIDIITTTITDYINSQDYINFYYRLHLVVVNKLLKEYIAITTKVKELLLLQAKRSNIIAMKQFDFVTELQFDSAHCS